LIVTDKQTIRKNSI